MLQMGQKPEHKKLTDKKFIDELQKKLLEEAKEFNPKNLDSIKELADLLEVIEQLAVELGTSFAELRKIQTKTRQKSGGFKNRSYIGRLDLKDDDRWASYYANEPDRFEEIK